MNEDPRCCGSGTCIINADGQCWCGQRWDGEKMCAPTDEARRSGDGAEATDSGEGSGDGGGD